MEGRNMHMLIAPLPQSAKKKKEAEKNDKNAANGTNETEGKDE
jgi:hypothetical protein